MTANSGMNFPAVYTITNTISGKIYVGQALNVRKRWQRHRWDLNHNKHRNQFLQDAWKKYGEESFDFKVVVNLKGTPKEELRAALNAAEVEILTNTPKAYNMMEAAKSGTTPSEETRAILSEKRKAMWRDPAFRERRRIALQEAYSDPEYRKRRADAVTAVMQTEEYRQKASKRFKELWANKEHQESQSIKRKANWQDPEYIAQQSESRSNAWKDPEVKEKRIKGMKASWQDQESRDKRVESITIANNTPERKEAASKRFKELWADSKKLTDVTAKRKELWSDPDRLAAHRERIKQTWIKRKADKAALIDPTPE